MESLLSVGCGAYVAQVPCKLTPASRHVHSPSAFSGNFLADETSRIGDAEKLATRSPAIYPVPSRLWLVAVIS